MGDTIKLKAASAQLLRDRATGKRAMAVLERVRHADVVIDDHDRVIKHRTSQASRPATQHELQQAEVV